MILERPIRYPSGDRRQSDMHTGRLAGVWAGAPGLNQHRDKEVLTRDELTQLWVNAGREGKRPNVKRLGRQTREPVEEME